MQHSIIAAVAALIALAPAAPAASPPMAPAPTSFTVQNLEAHANDTYGIGSGINDQGQVAGGDSAGHAVLYENGTLTPLGGLPDAESRDVVAINNQGFATGYCPDRAGNDLPVFFAAGQVIALPTLPGTASATPAAINEACEIAGTAIFPTDNPDGVPESVAVLWTPDTDCAPRAGIRSPCR